MVAFHLRARLGSFPHAYAVAVQRREETEVAQFVSRTLDPLQPHRVSALPPGPEETLLMLVV
jgi:hypothetical protein